MRLLSERLFSASTARTSVETAISTIWFVLGGTLAWSYTNLPVHYLALPLAAMIAAFRLHCLGHTFGQQLRREIVVAVLLTLVIDGIWLVSGVLASAYSLPREVFFTSSPFGAVLLSCLPCVAFIGTRVSLRAWLFWNQLRRTRFRWALTHAMLVTVALVSLLFIAVIFIPLRQDTLPLIATVLGAIVLIMAGTMIVLLPFFALFSYIFARHTTRRIDTLAAATSALRQGQYQTRVVVIGEDEIAHLQADFNAMADDLEQTLHELHTERDRVAQLLQAQRQLIASVSHELRTPVATIRSYLDAALQPFDEALAETAHALVSARPIAISPTTLQADLGVMQRETVRLQALIDDLFTLARAETHSLTFRCVPTAIGQLTQQIVETVAPVAWQRSRIDVVADIPPDLPYALLDGTRWEQIVHNLLHNAVRHTAPGGIIVVNVHVCALRSFCAWLTENGHIERNPALRLKAIGMPEPLAPKSLKPAHVNALLREAQQTRYAARDYAIIQLMVQTGMRIGECTTLRVSDAQLSEPQGQVTIRAGKGNKTRIVPLNASARQALADYLGSQYGVESTVKAVATAWAKQPVSSPLWHSQKGGALSLRAIGEVVEGLVEVCSQRNLVRGYHVQNCLSYPLDSRQSCGNM